MKKTDAWVVLRFDDESVSSLKDYIAIKGIYDDKKTAHDVAERLSLENRDQAQYLNIRSRRYTNEKHPEPLKKQRVQGFDLLLKSEKADNFGVTDEIETVRKLWSRFPFLPSKRKEDIFHPLLSYVVNLAIADELGGTVTDTLNSGWDIKLYDGRLIKVKTVILDPDGRKAPNLRFKNLREAEFDALAIVIFGPDLSIEDARLIPTDALDHYIGPATKQSVNLRVTRQLLNDPSATPILNIERDEHEESYLEMAV